MGTRRSIQRVDFAPIAIVGRACLLPGADSPAQLWAALSTGTDLVARHHGLVEGFEGLWDPTGFAMPATELQDLDPLVHWLLHTARVALHDAGALWAPGTGAIFGNLGFPSSGLAAFAQSVWNGSGDGDPRQRAMSSGSAEFLRRALALDRGCLSLDAACASSLYAIKLACDRLHDGRAERMLAGAVQCADPRFLDLGFSALQALSPSGRSRPFHAQADGLVPAQGAAFVVLKRLADARRDGDVIHGLIRGIGLSNDGRGKGLLVPAATGQQAAMRAAYNAAGFGPARVSLLECHATGTQLGDATEVHSSAAIYTGLTGVPIGSLKSNLGHLITAAGAAGLIKLLEAMRAGQRPPSLHAGSLNPALVDTPFRVLQTLEDWPCEGPRIAALSAFGFGGNNAHLLVSQDDPSLPDETPPSVARVAVAIVGLGLKVAAANDRASFTHALFAGDSLLDARGEGRLSDFALELDGTRFPPRDLAQALTQQLALLAAAREAVAELKQPLPAGTGVFVGMEPDPEVVRHLCRAQLAQAGADLQSQDHIAPALQAATVIGCMPNIPANRLSAQFDLAGPSFTLQAGPASGQQAFELAVQGLSCGELDTAVVGAVDLCCEPVQRGVSPTAPGDAAVLLVLRRLADAVDSGERIYAVVNDASADNESPVQVNALELDRRFGHAGAASGLLQLAVAALCLHHRRRVGGRLWLSAQRRQALVGRVEGSQVQLSELPDAPRRSESATPRLRAFSGADQLAVSRALRAGRESLEGPARLVLVATDEQFETARERALAHLQHGAPAGPGVHFCARPLIGELALVFAGAGAAYPGMGVELLQQLPQLLDGLSARSKQLATALDWAIAGESSPGLSQMLWGASALSQLHLQFSQHVLGLRPDAWLGYSSGETNALFGAGIWNDPDALIEQTRASGIMDHELGGAYRAVQRAWGTPVTWACWTVLAPVAEVREALAGIARVHLAIIHSDQDCVIAGDADGCETVVKQLGAQRCLRLSYPLAVHVPELGEVRELWRRLHTRAVSPLRHGRIYANAFGGAYTPDSQCCARAILEQADRCLDLRPAVLAAWHDGVRIFVEHGPGTTYGRAIRNILGSRESLVVSLDAGRGFEGTLGAVAALLAAGVDMDLSRLEQALAPVVHKAGSGHHLQVQAHPPELRLMQAMPRAPFLPEILPSLSVPALARLEPTCESEGRRSDQAKRIRHEEMPSDSALTRLELTCESGLSHYRQQLESLSQIQRQFQTGLAHSHSRFLELRAQSQALLFAASAGNGAVVVPSLFGTADYEAGESSGASSALPEQRPDQARSSAPPTLPAEPRFTRAQLEQHAGGRISDLFGPLFAEQDPYLRQVRMPQPPLLLADRVVELDAQPGSMGKGLVRTQTDVLPQAWYLHQGRMPAGVLIEAGQADLLLISWLGVDRFNRGERVYRLLGCELTYHGELPGIGDTLEFAIRIDGHAAQGDVRLMFFHYDCLNGGRKQLSVRQGQAGFFTAAELAASAGCLWTPETQAIVAEPRLDPPACLTGFSMLDKRQLQAFAAGDAHACFGAGFEFARTHTRTPTIQSGRMLLLDRVTALETRGGPWRRGYLRAELDIEPQQWFFAGHFKNDPCMPGTLMFEGCLQAMAVYLAALGYTLPCDGWRFEPVPELKYQLQCRGQVTPASRLLVTEVFVEECIAGPIPTLYADLLCTVDGLKAFHARRVALQLVPDWPLSAQPEAGRDGDQDTVAQVNGFRFDQRSLLACAIGRPSEAFGPIYQRFDGPQRVARLPGPPYLFMSRIAEVHGEIGVMQAGARVVAEYTVPADAWYFDEGGSGTMPWLVLLEAALQPCGWLSSYVGSALSVPGELGFRNLDGSATVMAEVGPHSGVLRTEVELTEVRASGEMIIESFAVRCLAGDRQVLQLQTVFGFFPPEALAAQAGLRTSEAQTELLRRPADRAIELRQRQGAWFAADRAPLPGGRLLMIDAIEGIWPATAHSGPTLRAVKHVDPGEWFFKAHFFSDPVQPGSLGIAAMLQSLQCWMLESGLDSAIPRPRFVAIESTNPHQWKYRGQVLPHHKQVHTTLEITRSGRDARGSFAYARASLWVDGRRIYEAQDLGMRIESAP